MRTWSSTWSAQIAIAVCGVIAAPLPAGADELRSSRPLGLHAPDDLVAGRDTTAEVGFAATAVTDDALTLITNAGTIEPPVANGRERVARWRLPDSRYPQVAIVAALDVHGAVRDWLAVPLTGRASVKVDTRVGSSVTLLVRGKEFGPVLADRRGIATVAVDVPPGVTRATAIAVDRAGRRGESEVELGRAPFSRVLAVCGASGDRVELLVVNPDGMPGVTAPTLSLSGASAGPPTTVAPGWFSVAIDAGAAVGDDVDVTAVVDGDPTTAGRCRLHLPPEAPTALRVIPARTTVVAGAGDLALGVELVYPGRRRPAATTLTAEADVGAVTVTPGDGPERWTARWSLPARLEGRTSARVRIVTGAGGAPLEATATITLAPGVVSSIDVESVPSPVRADGHAPLRLVARARDRHGNLVPVDTLVARALGEVGRFAATADGSLVATYRAPRSRSLQSDRVVIEEPTTGVTTTVRIALVPLAPPVRVALRIGWVDNLGRLGSPLVAVDASVALPKPVALADRLRAGVVVGAYRATTVAPVDSGEGVDVALTSIPMFAHLGYAWPVGPFELGASAGLGVAIVTAATESPMTGARSETQVRPLLVGAANAVYGLGRLAIVGELGYWAGRADTGEVHGAIGGVAVTVGVGARF